MAVVDIAAEAEIPPGQAARVFVGETPIAVFNVNGEYLAIDDTCSHEEFSLADGEVSADCTVECALHGARFDLHTGAALSLPATIPVGSYHAWADQGVVKVEVPDEML